MRSFMTRSSYIPKQFTLHLYKKELGYDVYLYERIVQGKTQYCAVGWTGSKQIKPALYSFYYKPENREQAVKALIQGCINSKVTKSERRKAQNQPHSLKVGDILHGSWGYEQTNCEFWQVVEVPTPNYVIIREIGQNYTEESFMSGHSLPRKDDFFGESQRRKVIDGYVKINQSCSVHLWDGKPKYRSSYA